MNLLCSGDVPAIIVPHLCGASLTALKKKSGGLRPIAVGEVLCRLTSKCILLSVSLEAVRVLSPLQVGVGVLVGCEAIVHSVNTTLGDDTIPLRFKWVLQIDFCNAFNSIDRHCMFEEVRARIPSMAAWTECCYGSQPILHLGKRTIKSCCGVQQGDPLGPLCFALALHPIVEKIAEEVPGLQMNAWYLDDGTLCGSSEDLLKALRIIEEDGPARGLQLNRVKSLLFVPADADLSENLLPSDIPIARDGFVLLGAPVGSTTFCSSQACKRVGKIQSALDLLPELDDSQMEYVFLRSCLSLPKFVVILRTCPPSFIEDAIQNLDRALYDSVSEIVGAPLPDWAWKKATLPVPFGGLGFRLATSHASFISSVSKSAHLVAEILDQSPPPPPHTNDALLLLISAVYRSHWSSIEDIDVPVRQRHLSRIIDQVRFESFFQEAPDIRSRALALSSSIHHAGDWLNVVPCSALGLHLVDWEFHSCLRYWLGLQMVEEGSSCPVCDTEADSMVDHLVTCRGNGDMICRHESLRDVLFSAAQSAALAPKKEVPSLAPGSSSRPADVFLPCWKRGRSAALDVTVVSPVQQLTINNAAVTQGYTIAVAEERKRRLHDNNCHQSGISFIPLVFESFGGWSREAA